MKFAGLQMKSMEFVLPSEFYHFYLENASPLKVHIYRTQCAASGGQALGNICVFKKNLL